MKNFIRFTDFFTAKPLQIKDSEENKDFFISFGKKDPRKYRSSYENLNGIPDVLGVKIAATHSGKVTGNNGFYLPDKMQAGVSSWLLPFPKPILLHHDDEEDAIGRLEDARYVDISMGFRQDFIKRKDKVIGDKPSDVLIDAFLKGELSPIECVDVVNNVFLIKDFNFTKDQSYPGLGYIEITASISDPDSIRKVIDRRYLTGSIGARTDAAVCNVCKKDWANAEDGMCEHRPGKEYDGVLCALIAGNLMYDEYSYVNRPADSHSQTIEIFQNGEIKNSFNYNESNDSIPEVGFNIVDSLTIFKDKELDKMKLTLDKVKELLSSFIEEKFPLFKDHLDLDKLAQKFFDTLEEDTTEEQLVQKFADQLNKYNLLFEDSEEILGSDPQDEDYAYIDMLIDFILDKEIPEEERKALWDAKLSTKKRKSLPDSSFCGPDRSFPVPDCCFFGPQKIKTLDGNDISIKEIVDKINNKEEVWVYGFDLNQKSIVPKRVTAAWKAKSKTEVIKVTLDNNEEIICTPNHPFLTREFEYTEASDLVIGQSLMPFYWKRQDQYNKENAVYEKIFQPYYRFWEYTHHMVARENFGFYADCDGLCVHHKDENKFNNKPSNLDVLTKKQHLLIHKDNHKNNNTIPTVDQIKAKSNFMKNRMAHILSDESLSAAYSDALSKGRRTYNWDNIYEEIGNTGMSLIDIYLAKETGIQLKFIADRLQIKEATIRRWLKKADFSNIKKESNDIVITLVEDYFSYIFGQNLEKIYEDYISNPNFSMLQDKYKIDRYILKKWFKKAGFETDRVNLGLKSIKENKSSILQKWKDGHISLSWLKNRIGCASLTSNDLYNHKVISVKEYPVLEDVYDIEVEGTNNFALSAGVFVHNSHYTSALRLLGRYKGPGDKDKIRACIERKGKRLGCNKKKDNVDDTQDIGIGKFTVDYFDNFEDKEILQILNGLEFVLEERDLTNPSSCEDMKNKISSLEEQLEKSINNDELKTELQNTIEDNKNLKNKITELNLSLKNNCIDKVIFFKKLVGEKVEDTLQKDLSEKTLAEITSLTTELEEKVDVEKLNDMLNLGIARQPTEKIGDPTLKFEDKTLDTKKTDSKIIEDKEIRITKEYLMDVQKEYMKLRIKNGLEAANDYLNTLKLAGYLPAEMPEVSDNNN